MSRAQPAAAHRTPRRCKAGTRQFVVETTARGKFNNTAARTSYSEAGRSDDSKAALLLRWQSPDGSLRIPGFPG